MKEGNIKQLIIAGIALGMIASIWVYFKDVKEIGYISAGIIVAAIIGILLTQFKK